MSVTWYTWLEQGRDIHCSTALVSRLGKALRFSRTDSDYLFRLAGYSPPSTSAHAGTVDPSVQAVFDACTGPVLLTNPRLDIVAFNRQADRVFQLEGRTGPFECNHLWRGFMDEERRKLYVDWGLMMARAVSVSAASAVGSRCVLSVAGGRSHTGGDGCGGSIDFASRGPYSRAYLTACCPHV